MINTTRISKYILLATLLALAATGARAGLRRSEKTGVSPLELTLTVNTAAYQPGEAIICEVTLKNPTGSDKTVAALDSQSIALAFQGRQKEQTEQKELQFLEPVASAREKTGEEILLAAHANLKRQFILTTATFERGEFALQAIYDESGAAPGKAKPKAYSRPAFFKVEGDKALVHRYLNGLATRQDAIQIASAKAGVAVARGEALLITDEYGFLKWWVNLHLAGAPGQASVKSYFINPYLAHVWKEAKPFTSEDRGSETKIPKDSQIAQKIRDQRAFKPSK